MLSKNQIKFITNLKQKKHREVNKMFFAEGVKVVPELIQSSLKLVHIYTTEKNDFGVSENLVTIITEAELKKISALTTPNRCLAIFEMPEEQLPADKGLILVLDDVRDPGNLGTIIRLCDWFGIESLVCSSNTVDVYNPKVVQATMGSITRVGIHYLELSPYLQKTSLPVYGTFMEGSNIYQEKLPQNAIVIMGNEANGISFEAEKSVTHKITIPRFGVLQQTESLNVATATSIVLSEFKRSLIS